MPHISIGEEIFLFKAAIDCSFLEFNAGEIKCCKEKNYFPTFEGFFGEIFWDLTS